MKCIRLVLLFLALCLRADAGDGATAQRVPESDGAADRARVGRTLYRHDFENIRDPDTGALLPRSAALGNERWPDFWEPVRAVGFPEYLIPTVRVEADAAGFIPGAYRDQPNHVLRMDFDGTRVGIRTRHPVPVDPSLSYEYSLFARDTGLEGARIRAGVDWMRIDPSASVVLRSDEIPDFDPGQLDWPVRPRRMSIHAPPPEANAARFFMLIERLPDSVGASYRGSIWLDDITLTPLPKILVGAPRADGRAIPVRYAGLSDNIPDPDNPGFFRGRRYSRRVEITDVFGRPVATGSNPPRGLEAGRDGAAVEEIVFPENRNGVYYCNIRLYGAEERLLANVVRSVAVMPSGTPRERAEARSLRPVFGFNAGVPPESVLGSAGLLRRVVERAGAKMAKIIPWPDDAPEAAANPAHVAGLTEEIRQLRSAGITVVGVIRPSAAQFGVSGIAPAIREHPDRLAGAVRDAGLRLGLFMDAWQWGDDDDDGLARTPPGEGLDTVVAALREFAGGMPTAATVTPGGDADGFPVPIETPQTYFGAAVPPARIWRRAATVFPWLFEPYYNTRGAAYPPADLSALAPPPPADRIEEEARRRRRFGSWMSLDLPPAPANEPSPAAERIQLEDLMVRTVYAAILSPDAIFLGRLFDPDRGLLRRADSAGQAVETMARPAYLAAITLVDLLEGARYLGRLSLQPPFEAHAFRLPGTDESVIALWHNGQRGELSLRREEIASGPPLELLDWAGNRLPLPDAIPVCRVPVFVRGLSANLLLTRMSMRINPDQPVFAMNRRQNQTLEIVNHLPAQLAAGVRLGYAARLPDGVMENNWTIRPDTIRFNLLAAAGETSSGRFQYSVTPDPGSQIQTASPDSVDKSGLKIARALVSFATSPPVDMTVYLPFRLRSEVDVDIEPLIRANDPHFVTLQLKIRWFPGAGGNRRTDIRLTPYYIKRGQMREPAPFPVTVPALPPDMRGNPNAPFESVELRIPKRPHSRTWIGLDESGGSSFYVADVTSLVPVE